MLAYSPPSRRRRRQLDEPSASPVPAVVLIPAPLSAPSQCGPQWRLPAQARHRETGLRGFLQFMKSFGPSREASFLRIDLKTASSWPTRNWIPFEASFGPARSPHHSGGRSKACRDIPLNEQREWVQFLGAPNLSQRLVRFPMSMR